MPTDPLTVICPGCLAPAGQQCYATSSDEPRTQPHRLRGMAAALRLERCPHCEGVGWTAITEEGAGQ